MRYTNKSFRWTEDAKCKDCQWPINEGQAYCQECQAYYDRMAAIQVDLSTYQPSKRKPLDKMLVVSMTEHEFNRYRRVYGSCIDERRNELHELSGNSLR